MTTIPASLFVSVTPSVLSAGGAELDVIGLALTTSNRVPLGAVYSFSSAAAVTTFFGNGSTESRLAAGGSGYGSGYFGGFTNSDVTPGSMLFAQFNPTAVPAYLWGGNVGAALSLAQLQALSGTLDITIDGVAHNAGAINLSGATSFSNAASLISTGINGAIPSIGTSTGSTIAAASFSVSGWIAGNTLTVTAVGSGTIVAGAAITGTGVSANTTIGSQISGTAGGVGVYSVNNYQSVASSGSPITIAGTYGLLTVGAPVTGTWGVGQTVSGGGTLAGTIITQLGSGTGGAGSYYVNLTQTVGSAALASAGTAATVAYDSVSGAFVITSGNVGAASTIAFATGTLAASLLLTSATGAFVSQGAAASTPAATMNAIVGTTTNWVTYFTAVDPDAGNGSIQKQAFAAWKKTYPNRYAYIAFDTDPTARNNPPVAASLGQILLNNGDSGTCLISTLTDLKETAFVAGAAASIDFEEANGRTTFAYKEQAGLVSDVNTATAAVNLGGNPQTPGSFGNGYNYYGAVGAAAQNFTWFQRGTVTGPFKWLESYINQIWWSSLLQNALLDFMSTTKSVPFNNAGASAIEQALQPGINAGVSFGAAAPGTISASQAAAVNTAAGANVSSTLQTQGYYLQVLQESSTVRASRGPWATTLWYLDRGSVQSFALNTVAVQ